MKSANRFFAVLTSELPRAVEVGKGSVLHLEGWVHHPGVRLQGLAVSAAGIREPVRALFKPSPEVLLQRFEDLDAERADASTAFAALVPLRQIRQPALVDVALDVTCRGRSSVRLPLGAVELKPGRTVARTGTGKRVAICMATFNPVLELFERQVASLIGQTHEDWICIVADDGSKPDVAAAMLKTIATDRRFTFAPSHRRLGFYRNFERALSLVTPDAAFVGLCDHDDYWHPDKVAVLLERFGPDTTLVYSDMNITTDRGEVISTTYWTKRANNHTNIATLLLANTITGAASLFRASLLDDLLPFPPVIGQPYHDHWIACCAFALGDVAYVDRPLYDYVQHGGNVIGHYAPDKSMRARAGLLIRAFVRDSRQALRTVLAQWRAIYLWDVLRVESIALTLHLRGGRRLARGKRGTLKRFAHADRSWRALVILLVRGLKRVGRRTQTLGAERAVAGGILWRRLTWAKARVRAWKP